MQFNTHIIIVGLCSVYFGGNSSCAQSKTIQVIQPNIRLIQSHVLFNVIYAYLHHIYICKCPLTHQRFITSDAHYNATFTLKCSIPFEHHIHCITQLLLYYNIRFIVYPFSVICSFIPMNVIYFIIRFQVRVSMVLIFDSHMSSKTSNK